MKPTKNYSPGLHILLTLEVENLKLLRDLNSFINFSEQLVQKYHLQIVGTSSFQFNTMGFTAAICLMESHICIHTWPEFNQLTLDVYLCNYLKDNSQKVEKIAKDFENYFEAKVLTKTKVNR